MAIDSFVPNSSFLALVKYDDVARTMEVTFKNGTSTKYLYIFKPTYDSFKLAPSHGSHFAKNLKGKFLSVALVKHTVGQRKSTALHKIKIERGLTNGQRHGGHRADGLESGLNRILKSAGLIPTSLHKPNANGPKGRRKV